MDTTREKKSTEDANELENSVKGKKDERKQTEHIKEKKLLESRNNIEKTNWITNDNLDIFSIPSNSNQLS